MTKRELIEALEALDVGDDTPVAYEYDNSYIYANDVTIAYDYKNDLVLIT